MGRLLLALHHAPRDRVAHARELDERPLLHLGDQSALSM
jgi:hypothetical protein